MSLRRLPRTALFVLCSGLLALAVHAQSSPSDRATSSTDRLFGAFVEDATTVSNQWWEGQLQFTDGDVELPFQRGNFDRIVLKGIVALQPWKNVEVGARVGFGTTDTSRNLPDGEGATDLDLWSKYHFGTFGGATEVAAGGVLTVPTGDDTAGLGFDAFSVSAFGAVRHRLDRLILAAHAGFQLNGDATIYGSPDLDGKFRPIAGFGVIFPVSDQVSLTGEAALKGKRFERLDADARLIGGFNWRPFNEGMFRGALTVGLADGAPDYEIVFGFATTF